MTDPDLASRVLLVLGNTALAKTADFTLGHGGYIRRSELRVKAAAAAIAEWKPHLVLLDIALESGAATQIIDDAQAAGMTGVIALTRRGDLPSKLDAFERGADDYITVPFVPDDLLARVRAVLRRIQGQAGRLVPRQRVGDLELDVLSRNVIVGGDEVRLTPLEQALLYVLAANAGRVLTRAQILDALWGRELVSETNLVDKHVRALRAKLKDDWRTPRYVETVPGVGYRFIIAPEPG